MPGTLLISLDCEGKWGMADDPSMLGTHRITDESLRWAYSQLFTMLEENELRATFAVVGLFVAGPEATQAHIREMSSNAVCREWLTIPMQALESKATHGWFYEELPELILRSGTHQVASHGYSHLPFTSAGFTDEMAHHELAEMQSLSRRNSWGVTSMVFPRNQVAFTHLLSGYGIEKFRPSVDDDGIASRVGSLLKEFDVHAEAESFTDGQTVPAGRFINWRSGARLVVPPSVTKLRWKRILRNAVSTGRCAHLWFHPHNLITGRSQLALVGDILKMAGDHVRRGELESCTFGEVR
jgi:hypothetical protein